MVADSYNIRVPLVCNFSSRSLYIPIRVYFRMYVIFMVACLLPRPMTLPSQRYNISVCIIMRSCNDENLLLYFTNPSGTCPLTTFFFFIVIHERRTPHLLFKNYEIYNNNYYTITFIHYVVTQVGHATSVVLSYAYIYINI